MPSLFAGLARAASATVDAIFAEDFEIEARSVPAIDAPVLANGRPDVDARRTGSTTRLSYAFRGVFVAAGSVIHAHGRAMADSTTRAIVTDRPMIDVDVASLQQRPARGDIIRRFETGERFEISDPLKAVDHRRAQIWLTEIPT